jgi:hypothetical protein
MLDADGYTISEINSGSNQNAFVTMTTPATIPNANMWALDSRPYAITSFSVSFINLHPIPQGGYVMIQFNTKQIALDSNVKTWVCSSNVVLSVLCTYLQVPPNNFFRIDKIFSQAMPTGQNITLTLGSLVNSIVNKGQSSAWTLTTYTNEGYMIDQASNGLSITINCNSPCLTCSINNP